MFTICISIHIASTSSLPKGDKTRPLLGLAPIPPGSPPEGNTMRKIIVSLAVAIAMTTAVIVPAAADATPTPVYADKSSSLDVEVVSVTRDAPTTATVVIYLKDIPVRGKRGRCTRWRAGWNSGKNQKGLRVGYKDKWLRVCQSKRSPTGWVVVGGGRAKSKSLNPVSRLKNPPARVVPALKVRIVKYFASGRYTAVVRAVVNTVGASSTLVTCEGAYRTPTALAGATGTGRAEAYATGRANTKQDATGAAYDVLDWSDAVKKASLEAKAASEINLMRALDGWCENGTPNYSCPSGSATGPLGPCLIGEPAILQPAATSKSVV